MQAYDFALCIWILSVIQIWLITIVFITRREICRGKEIEGHRLYAGTFVFVTLLLLYIAHTAVRVLHLPLTEFFRVVHAPCIVLMLFFWMLWALSLAFKGKRHAIWFHAATLFTLLVTVSGDILAYQLMWLHHPLALL